MIDAASIDKYISKSMLKILGANRFEIVRDEICALLIKALTKHCSDVSGRFSIYFNEKIPSAKIPEDDFRSHAIAECSAVLALTLSSFRREIEMGESLDFSMQQGISCSIAVTYLQKLGKCFDDAILSWKSEGDLPVKSKKFDRKRKERRYHLKSAL